MLEDGELVTEGLAREVREETGLEIETPRLAFVAQLDSRRREGLRHGDRAGEGYLATVWTFEVAGWYGELAPRDPDGVVAEAAFVPLREAIERLAAVSWHALTVRHLRGELAPGSLHLQRRHEDGRIEEL